MKSFIRLVIALGICTQTLPAHALVSVVQNCRTSDGKYQITLLDNEGIGIQRTSSYSATILDSQGEVVGQYEVEYVNPPVHSISFGHADYLDVQTQGREFDFALPSTNTPKSVSATLNNGTQIVYGFRFQPSAGEKNQGGLNCAE